MNTPGFSIFCRPEKLSDKRGIPETRATLPYWNCGHTRAARHRPRHLCQDCVVIAPALAAVSSPFVQQGRKAASIVRPFIIPVWSSPLLHSSIRPFISPSISPYRLFLRTWIHPSRPGHRPRFTYRRLGRFSKLAEIRNPVWLAWGWRHLQVHRGAIFFFNFNFAH